MGRKFRLRQDNIANTLVSEVSCASRREGPVLNERVQRISRISALVNDKTFLSVVSGVPSSAPAGKNSIPLKIHCSYYIF